MLKIRESLVSGRSLVGSQKKFPNISIATVYRTLEKLANLDILHKSMFEGNKFRYELAEDDKHHHHHVVCLNCGKYPKSQVICSMNWRAN